MGRAEGTGGSGVAEPDVPLDWSAMAGGVGALADGLHEADQEAADDPAADDVFAPAVGRAVVDNGDGAEGRGPAVRANRSVPRVTESFPGVSVPAAASGAGAPTAGNGAAPVVAGPVPFDDLEPVRSPFFGDEVETPAVEERPGDDRFAPLPGRAVPANAPESIPEVGAPDAVAAFAAAPTADLGDRAVGRPWVRNDESNDVDPAEAKAPVASAAQPVPAVGAEVAAPRVAAGPVVRNDGAASSARASGGSAAGVGSEAVSGASGRGAADGGPGSVAESGSGGGGAQVPKRLAAVERLRTQVATLPLILDVEGVAAVRHEREDLLSQLDDYILPRLQRPDAPALAVIGGSTGAGKSTLTNSIVGREVSRSGVLRPTTRSPVLVHHPADSGAFLSQRILPRLTRVTSEAPEPIQPIDPNAPRITGLRLVPYDGLAPGLAIIDAPDIDSLVETNRDLAVQLLQAADLWVFVTTAARYADATPWQMLSQAAERGAAIAVVLDRVPPEALQELRIHLATKLRDNGLGGAALFTVPETPLENGFLPEKTVRPLREWLSRIAGNQRSRSVVVERTLAGALRSLPARARILAKAAAAQADGWSQLWEEIDAVFIPARFSMLDELSDGSLMSGQVLSHWQEFIARGDLASRLGGVASTRVQRIGAALTQPEQSEQPLTTTVCEAVSASVHHSVRAAMEQVIATWRKHPYGAALLTARGHQVTPADRESLLAKPVADWRQKVAQQVTEALSKAREEHPELSVDQQTVVDVMFVLTVAADHNVTGTARNRAARTPGKPGPTAGGNAEATAGEEETTPGSTVGARLAVEELLGEDTVRSIIEAAREDLLFRAGIVIDDERLRLERVLENPEDLGLRVGALLDAASAVNIAE